MINLHVGLAAVTAGSNESYDGVNEIQPTMHADLELDP